MADRKPAPIIGDRTRACGGIGRRARLRALWGVSPVGVRVSLGASRDKNSRQAVAPATGSRDDPSMSLRAAGIEAFGGEVGLLELQEPPPLEAGEVLIQVRAAGVGNWEDIVRTGGWDVGRVPPMALGVEAAGEVVAVGPDVEWPATGA